MANSIMLFFLCYNLIQSLDPSELLILTSDFTHPDLISDQTSFPNTLNLSNQTYQSILDQINKISFLLIADMTNSTFYSTIIDSISNLHQCAYISPLFNIPTTDFRFLLHPTQDFLVQSLNNLISFVKMKQIYLLCSSNLDDVRVCDELLKINENFKEFIKYSTDIELDYADRMIGKMLKANGAKSIVVVDSSNSLGFVIASIINRNINVKGSSIVILKKGQKIDWVLGSFVLVQRDLEESVSIIDFEMKSLRLVLKEIPSFMTGSELLDYLRSRYPEHCIFNSISIINPGPFPRVIGYLSPFVNVLSSIVYPGNLSTYDPESKLNLKISIANGTHEIFNLSQSDLFAYWYKGAEYAVSLFNTENQMPGYEVTLHPTDCGLYLYHDLYYHLCLSQYQDFGLAYLAPFWQGAANGTYRELQSRGLQIPQISPICQNNDMDRKSTYPLFLKLSVSVSLYFSSAFLFQRSLGWKYLNVLATDDPIYQEQYIDILTYSKLMGIEVLNPRDKQVIPWTYTRNDFEKYREYFEAAKKTRCRVFIILAYDRGLIWEALYDVGMRKGEFIQIGDSAFLVNLHVDIEEKYLRKRRELAEFSFAIAYREWIGDVGERTYYELSKVYPDTSYMCFAYDTFSVVKEAINFIILKGENYENQTELAKVMRNNRIKGCLGNIYFDKDTNSRSQTDFSIYQIIYKPNQKTFIYTHVAYVNKLSSIMIKRTNSLLWYNSSTTPDNLRPINKCPFDDYQVRSSKKGSIVLYSILCYFALISIASAVLSTKFNKTINKEITEKTLIKFSDMIFLSYFLFQTLQFVYNGPEQKGLKKIFNDFQELASMDFLNYFNLNFFEFWILFMCTMVFSFFWSVLCLFIVVWRNERVLGKFEVLKLDALADYALPVLGHLTMSPIFSMHLNIFSCTQGIDDDLTKSFLQDDCDTFCWKSSHLISAAISLTLSTLYIFFTIFSRPYWELTMPDLNLKTNPKYLNLLTCIQFFSVLLSKSLRPVNPLIHGYVLSSLIFLLIIITYLIKPYNYARINIIQISSLCISFWAILAASLFQEYSGLFISNMVLVSGVIIIAIFTLALVKRCPDLIYSSPSLNIAELFLFQFRNRWTDNVKPVEDMSKSIAQQQVTVETMKDKSDIRLPTQL